MSTPTETERAPEEPGHYCWIRIVKVGTPAERTASRVKVVETLRPRDERRPPPKIKSTGATPLESMDDAWTAVEECLGRDDAETVFEYGPAFQYRSLAEEWILTAEGVRWDEHAENRMLISHRPRLGPHAVLAESAGVCLPDPAMSKFPDACWEPELRRRWLGTQQPTPPGGASAPAVPDDPEFLGVTMALKPTDEFRQQPPVILYGPGASRKGPDEALVDAEAHGAARVIDALFKQVGIRPDRPPMLLRLKQARSELMNQVERVVYTLKVIHNRPRPWMIFPRLEPKYAGQDWRNPRHPAYPSGHAVTASLWATLLADRYPRHALALKGLAREIAQRRVDAGLHFQGDCDDGLALGERMAAVLLKRIKADDLPGEFKLFGPAYKSLPDEGPAQP